MRQRGVHTQRLGLEVVLGPEVARTSAPCAEICSYQTPAADGRMTTQGGTQ